MTGGATYIAATCGSEATEGWATSIGGGSLDLWGFVCLNDYLGRADVHALGLRSCWGNLGNLDLWGFVCLNDYLGRADVHALGLRSCWGNLGWCLNYYFWSLDSWNRVN
jgi:2,3-bisphosphoglycerate-independent phosphoglycerate mutase